MRKMPSNCYYFRFDLDTSYGTTYANDISINYPSTDTTYHAHNPNSAVYPVSWQTEAGTVYGGTVDVVTGVLTVTHGYVDLGDLVWQYASDVFINYTSDVDLHTKERGGYILSDRYKKSGSASAANMADFSVQTLGGGGGNNLWIKDSRYTSPADFKTAVSGSTLVYELATPQTYQLTPTQIQTLLGQNNVWADCGDVEVQYKADVQRWVEKRLNA